jgi:hypothetical protein
MPATSAVAAAATHDELKHVLGDIEDAKTLEILALRPTVAELEEAMLWAEGEGESLGKEGRPLTGIAAQVYDILIRDELEAEARGP